MRTTIEYCIYLNQTTAEWLIIVFRGIDFDLNELMNVIDINYSRGIYARDCTELRTKLIPLNPLLINKLCDVNTQLIRHI